MTPPGKKPLLCRLGWHTSTFFDSGLCFGAQRCNKCTEWTDPHLGARVDRCRKYVSEHGMHIARDCTMPHLPTRERSITLEEAATLLGIDPASIRPVDPETFRSWQEPRDETR